MVPGGRVEPGWRVEPGGRVVPGGKVEPGGRVVVGGRVVYSRFRGHYNFPLHKVLLHYYTRAAQSLHYLLFLYLL